MSTIGIDLGTTNTVTAIDQTVIGLGAKKTQTLPSVVAYPPSGVTLVGHEARRRKTIDPQNTVFSSKRIIGRKWLAAETREFEDRYPFELVEKDGQPGFKTRAGVFKPTDIAATVLSKLSENNQIAALKKTCKTVIAVPSLFGESERQATAQAARQAGFTSVTTIDEPSATASAYLAAPRQDIQYAAVYDLGGGTFDLAIVDCRVSPYEVLAHAGDLYLGGDDIDMELAGWVIHNILRDTGWDLASDRPTFQRLIIECERAKIEFSQKGAAQIDLMQVDPAAPLDIPPVVLDNAIISHTCEGFVRRTFSLCDEVLHQSNIKISQIDAVFVAGGTTMVPPVAQGISKYFGKPIVYPHNPLHIVAIGASIPR